MIDFHTHILPGIDDGSKDIEMTREMLLMERSMGTDLIIATPHFYAHRKRISEFLTKREKRFEEVKDLIKTDPDLPEVRVGAEVYYFTGIGRAEQIKELCIEGTDIILLELPFRPWDKEIIEDIRELRYRQHLRVVLAHVERYKELQKDKHLYDEILDQADLIQINAGSFTEGLFKRNFALKLLKSGRPAIIGSDCHNTTTRKPNLDEGFEVIGKKAGADTADTLIKTAESLFR